MLPVLVNDLLDIAVRVQHARAAALCMAAADEIVRLQRENADQVQTIARLHQRIAELARRLAATEAEWKDAKAAPLGRCARCGDPLNNVAPGFSIVKGGITVCAVCLRPGEEIARARGM